MKHIHSSLTLDLAAKIVDGAIAIRRRENLLPLAVAVLDAGAQLVAFKRKDGCGVMRFDIALGKAHGALGMGMSSRLIRDRLAQRADLPGGACGGIRRAFYPDAGRRADPRCSG